MVRWKKLLYALLAGAVAVAAGMYLSDVLSRPDTCAPGVERIGTECIGVARKDYAFETPEIADVAKKIDAENERIAREDYAFVTVAMMLPLQSTDAPSQQSMRSDLQGAYLGQRKANSGQGDLPKIKLVLANPGHDYGQQARVVKTLLGMTGPKDNLRVVTGFNLSLPATQKAIEKLTRNKISVVASRITADPIANPENPDDTKPLPFPGLARIIATNGDAARALANFYKAEAASGQKTVVVRDTRDDSYDQSLADAFNSLKGTAVAAPMTYVSPGIDEEGATGSLFSQIANNICGSDADTVYFAGRALHLKIFALKLAALQCANKSFTIVSGSDAASLRRKMTEPDWAALRGTDGKAKVTVVYAAPGHPDAWSTELAKWRGDPANHGAPLPQYLTEPAKALEELKSQIRKEFKGSSAPDLADSRTMLVYDGMITVGEALRKLVGPNAAPVPGLEALQGEWPQLHTQHRVPGTSGLICLTGAGNPYDKPLAVVQLDPSQTAPAKQLEFVGLAWPEGEAQRLNCVIPAPAGRGGPVTG